MISRRILIIICCLTLLFSLEVISNNLQFLYLLPILCLIFLLLTLKILIKEKVFRLNFYHLAILPLLFFALVTFYVLLPVPNFFRQGMIAFFILLLAFYLENIFLLYYLPSKYQAKSLEDLASILGLIIFFLLVVNLNALSIFLNLPLWQLSIILIVITSLILLQAFWINKVSMTLRYIYLLIINVVLLEFFWALNFLPMNFLVNSTILTIIYYLIWGISRAKLAENSGRKIIWRYLLISGILLMIIIVTSPWT
jgi:hypothetical protein